MVDEPRPAEVVIAGAGLAGVCAAIVLAGAGVDVALIDQKEEQPRVFKAEKLEPDQVALLRQMGLFESVLDVCSAIRHVAVGAYGRVLQVRRLEQYGYSYEALVNRLRRALPSTVRSVVGRITALTSSDEGGRVTLSDDRTICGRLVVVATGTAGRLHEGLDVHRRMVAEEHSVCIGFSCAPPVALPRGAEALTYFGEGASHCIDYVSFFPIGPLLRANLFTYWSPKDPRLEDLRARGIASLEEMMPRLSRITGSLRLESKVEARPIDLYRLDDPARAGVVFIGDAYQSVCPATGSGLSKVLTDVKVLCDLVPRWLNAGRIDCARVQEFYDDARKRATDDSSLASASYRKRFGSDRSWRMAIHRMAEYLRMWRAGETTESV